MNLLFDIGNSRIKWRFQQPTSLALIPGSGGGAAHAADLDGTLLQILPSAPQGIGVSSVWIACVAKSAIADRVQAWAEGAGLKSHRVHPGMSGLGIRHVYQNPQKLGVDRWLAMGAAWHRTGAATGVIDAGSALTVDVVDESGAHRGGLIMPGVSLLRASLRQGTALNWEACDHQPGLGRDTDSAISNGIAAAMLGAVQTGIAWGNETCKPGKWLLTGGDAALVAALLGSPVESPVEMVDDLVLEGLALLASRNA